MKFSCIAMLGLASAQNYTAAAGDANATIAASPEYGDRQPDYGDEQPDYGDETEPSDSYGNSTSYANTTNSTSSATSPYYNPDNCEPGEYCGPDATTAAPAYLEYQPYNSTG